MVQYDKVTLARDCYKDINSTFTLLNIYSEINTLKSNAAACLYQWTHNLQ